VIVFFTASLTVSLLEKYIAWSERLKVSAVEDAFLGWWIGYSTRYGEVVQIC
jgi:hypothetical protein